MNRWRTWVILLLLAAPILGMIGVGSLALWRTGQTVWMWVVFLVAWGVALVLARFWREKFVRLKQPEMPTTLHWTPRDQNAWEIVEAKIATADAVEPEAFTNLQFYFDIARDLSQDIATCYHPKAKDPVGSLTIPEILAAAQLALEDLADLYDRYVPAGHLLSINNFRSLAKLPKRYRMVSNIANVAAALFSPVAAAGRFVASKTVMSPVGKVIQSNLLTWFYTAYLQRVGFYLIEMNSGRLKGGSQTFREAFARFHQGQHKPWEMPDEEPPVGEDAEHADGDVQNPKPEPEEESTATEPDDAHLTVCLVGQTEAGRSSVIRTLNAHGDGESWQKSAAVIRHDTVLPGSVEPLILLDTTGYGDENESRTARKDRYRAVAGSDLVLLVMRADSPARDGDCIFLDEMTAWFSEQPQLKPPPIIVVLTHIDFLKPLMKWSPPYNWQEPTELKEQSIHDAVEHVTQELGSRVSVVVPVCSDVANSREFGVREWLVPALNTLADEARACGSIRQLHENLNSGKAGRVWDQVRNIGKALRGK